MWVLSEQSKNKMTHILRVEDVPVSIEWLKQSKNTMTHKLRVEDAPVSVDIE